MLTSRLAYGAVIGATTTSIVSPALAQIDVWQLLDQIEIEEIVTETTYEVRKRLPEELDQGMNGVEITGYAVPMIPGDMVQELLLVSDMGICPLCGSEGHGAALQVTLAQPIASFAEGTKLRLRGDLRAVRDPETWQAAILLGAELITE